MNWLQTLFGWLRSQTATVKDAPDKLAALIEAKNFAIGPMPRTGGVIHKIDTATAHKLADLIRQYVPQYPDLTIPLVASWLMAESRFDELAENPNRQDAKPGETADEALLHMDAGLCQFDIATLASKSDPLFADLNGLSLTEIKAKAMDPEWAVPAFCKFASRLFENARIATDADPSILKGVPNGDRTILAVQSYNSGFHGASLTAKNDGVKGNWKYGTTIVSRAADFAVQLD